MKRFLHTSLLLSLLSPTCFAEETAPWEVFGGYSFQRADVRQYFISRPTPLIYAARHHYVNMNGWELSVTENLNRWFGGTLDISGYYKSPAVASGIRAPFGSVGSSVTTRDHIFSILYGPQFTYRKDANIGAPGRLIFSSVPFAHILFGGAHTSATVGPPGPHASDFSFAMALGGGLDWPLTSDASIRLLQLDYLRTNALGAGQNNYRASIGVVLRLGKPK